MESLINLAFKFGAFGVVLFVIAVLVLPQSVRILREYERGVVFRLGKLIGAKGPGLAILFPFVDKLVRMDLRVVTIDVPKQEIMTKDNVPATVDAVVYFRVVHQGDQRGDQGGLAAGQHEARDGQAGRGRARTPGEGGERGG